MPAVLVAQVAAGGIVSWLLVAIVIAAVIAIAWVAMQAMGVPIPPWAGRIIGIILVAAFAILAIRFLVGLTW